MHINISSTGTLPSFKLHLVLVGITQTSAAQQNNFSGRILATKLNAFGVDWKVPIYREVKKKKSLTPFSVPHLYLVSYSSETRS